MPRAGGGYIYVSRGLASVSNRFRTPHWALTACALVATGFVIACYPWESHFAGVDTCIIALTFTYLLIAVSVITLPRCDPQICRQVSFMRSRTAQLVVAVLAIAFLFPLLILELFLLGTASAVFWAIAMGTGAVLFIICWHTAKARGDDLKRVFASLPDTAEDIETGPRDFA